MKILVVEDHIEVLNSIVELLSNDFTVDKALEGEEGFYLALQNIYDVIVLDVMLPEKNGFEIVKDLRKKGVHTPVLFLTAKDSLEDRVEGLNLGADDYLVKPFQGPELLARIYALLRRSGKLTIDSTLKYQGIILKGKEYPVEINHETIHLTIKQYELLEYFIQNQGKILMKEQIFDRVWGFDSDTTVAIVEVYVHQLRKKLEPFNYGSLIKTVRGIGYIMKDD
ncbi:response regulator transcription factor [Bacillus sp. AFS041924]|uniref:response regulator transcription factor n=1 Tax=Bacillus sp. AFS041924 TaxID=2033503 RepID=UPI000BFB6164|nr:response regulator transcription factor [Bacillus sp. AFS041924]PGS55818.1 DNA-binding response regulator [Bacillus sp. AFS041924]